MKVKFLFFMMIFSTGLIYAEMYKKDAVVSFYADDFHGKKTSSGEIFNMNDFTCANKTLPFNTQLKVTNPANGKSVIVRVNDRGPFVIDRELDLSKAAAQKLDIINTGTAHVSIEIIKRGEDTDLSRITAEKAMKIVNARSAGRKETEKKVEGGVGPAKQGHVEERTYLAGTYWDLQIGAFSTRENANRLAQKLLDAGYKDVVFQKTSTVYRVAIRKVPAAEVNKMKKKLVNDGFAEPVVRQRKQ